MNNRNKLMLSIILIGMLGIFMLNFIGVRADSGFDVDYDRGGSDYSGGWSSNSGIASSSEDAEESFESLLFIISLSNVVYLSSIISDRKREIIDDKKEKDNKIIKKKLISLLIAIALSTIHFIFTKYPSIPITLSLIYLIFFFGDTLAASLGIYKFIGSIEKKNKKKILRALKEKNKKDTDVKIPGFDRLKFIEDSYDNFVTIQESWMNFDYDNIEKLVTNELYNSYITQLKTLKIKNQKNIMSNFELVSNRIVYFDESEREYTIKTEMQVKFYDYIVDKDNNIIRGNDDRRVIMTYELTYVKSKDNKENICPNCKSPLGNNYTNVCKYCGSTIINDYHDFVLSKKEAIGQRPEY